MKADAILEGKIVSISFENIYTTGVRNFSDQWTLTKTKDGQDLTASYEQTWTDGFNIPAEGEKIIGSPMYLMPQDLKFVEGAADNAMIKVGVKVPGKEETYYLSKSLKSFAEGEWKSGKVYTYVISTPKEIQLEVEDRLSGTDNNKKDNLTIKNTGLLEEVWIRVHLEGAWYVEQTIDNKTEKLMVADWKETDGTFVWANGANSWTDTDCWKYSDGYFYYLQPLPRGATAPKLFESYTLSNEGSRVANSYLEFSVVAQAFEESDAAALWPSAVAAAMIHH